MPINLSLFVLALALLVLVVLLALYLLIVFVFHPYSVRRHYAKFRSVNVSPSFIPLLGDFYYLTRDYSRKGKFMGLYLRDVAMRNPKQPMMFVQLGREQLLLINSPSVLANVQ